MKRVSLALVANLYPNKEKPYFGTFVKNIYEELDDTFFDKQKMVLPDFGQGVIGYVRFYKSVFVTLLKFRGVVYVHYVSHSVLPVVIAALFNSKISLVLNYHGSDAFSENHESWLKNKLKVLVCKVANKFASLIIVPSLYFKNMMAENYAIDNKEIFVSPSGGVDSSVFFLEPSMREQNSTKKYLFASRMIEGKGCILAAQTALEIAKTDKQASFCFVGNGPQQQQVSEILNTLIIQGRCEIKGSLSQSDLAKEFQKATFFLFPSMREGESLGLVVIEAMACGAIPIAIRQGALSEILSNHTNELTSDKNNYQALSLALNKMNEEQLSALRDSLLNISKNYERNGVMQSLSNQIRQQVSQ